MGNRDISLCYVLSPVMCSVACCCVDHPLTMECEAIPISNRWVILFRCIREDVFGASSSGSIGYSGCIGRVNVDYDVVYILFCCSCESL